jgi:hypothetical protein
MRTSEAFFTFTSRCRPQRLYNVTSRHESVVRLQR